MSDGWIIGQQIQDHGGPACIAAPSSSKYKRTEYLCHGIMQDGSLKNPQKKIVTKALYLHVLTGKKARVNQHIEAYGKLDHPPCIFMVIIVK